MAKAEENKFTVARPEDFLITVIARSAFKGLREEMAALIHDKKVQWYDCDEEPDILAKVGLEEPPDQPVVIVSAPGVAEGMACVLSMVGESVIIHCEDKVIPLLPGEGGSDGTP